MDFSALYTVVATLFLVMAVGFFCRKVGIIDDIASKKLSALILKVGQPAMIILALASPEYSDENLKLAGIITLLGFVLHAVFALFAYFSCKFIKNRDQGNISEFGIIFTNCAFIGFPIFEALFGPIGRFMGAFFVVSFNVLIWTLGVAIFARGRDDIKLTLKKALINFGTIPCVIGFALYLLKNPAIGFEMPAFISEGFAYLRNLCTPISVLITGALIATQKPKQIFASRTLYYFNLLKLFVLPLIVCLVAKLIGLNETYALFATAAAALPAASSVAMMTELYRLDSGYSSLIVGTSSLISVLSMPLVLKIAQWLLAL